MQALGVLFLRDDQIRIAGQDRHGNGNLRIPRTELFQRIIQHDPSYLLRIIDRIDKRQRAAPGMTDNNRALDMELLERVVKQTRLNFDGHVNMLRPLAAAMARTIKGDDLMKS